MKRIKKLIGLLFLNLVGTGFYNFGKDEEKEINQKEKNRYDRG
jgi:hypothetical protein